MPQSLSRIHIHLIFSTKERMRIIAEEDSINLHAYLGGVLKKHECWPVEINSRPDHLHVLFLLARTMTVADVVAQLKRGSTLWLRGCDPRYEKFQWQSGYGAFAVSESNVETVQRYIQNQKEHHRVRSFQEEYRAFLTKSDIEFDERYVWE